MDVSIEKQTEINEWSYNSKRDTLFFFQLIFIGVMILIIMYLLSNAGIISKTFVIYIMIIVFILLIFIWYSKHKYTIKTRDKQHWNRRNFSEDGNKPSPLPATTLSSVATSTTENCNRPTSTTSSSPSGRPSGRPSGSTLNNINYVSDYDEKDRESRGWWYGTRRGNNYDHEYTDDDYDLNLRFDSLPYRWGNSNGNRNNNEDGYGGRDRSSFGASGSRFNTPDGSLGIWDTTGEFDDFDDVSTTDLNDQQGRISRSLRNRMMADDDDYLSNDEEYSADLFDVTNEFSYMTLEEIIDYCEVNKGGRFPGNLQEANMDDDDKNELIRKLGGPATTCHRLLCTVDPNRSMRSVTTNVNVPCKELYPNLK